MKKKNASELGALSKMLLKLDQSHELTSMDIGIQLHIEKRPAASKTPQIGFQALDTNYIEEESYDDGYEEEGCSPVC